jgi:pSer/pThr/pTyr-binding forkhead associated (FHA) protein
MTEPLDSLIDGLVTRLIKNGAADLALYHDGKIIPFPDSGLTIGRGHAADINTADDELTSSRHARIYRDGPQTLIEDCGSTNGTWLNNHRVWDRAPLALNDVIRVGGTSFAVTWCREDETPEDHTP